VPLIWPQPDGSAQEELNQMGKASIEFKRQTP
jgi:hypothetical protein